MLSVPGGVECYCSRIELQLSRSQSRPLYASIIIPPTPDVAPLSSLLLGVAIQSLWRNSHRFHELTFCGSPADADGWQVFPTDGLDFNTLKELDVQNQSWFTGNNVAVDALSVANNVSLIGFPADRIATELSHC